MLRIANFEKVSFEQFYKDCINTLGKDFFVNMKTDIADYDGDYVEKVIKQIYDNIKLPERATAGSAGYDFFAPFDIHVKAGDSIVFPTGIRCFMEDGWVLQCYPRSGLGFKYKWSLWNTVGIIDADYAFSNNEGHIFAKFGDDNNEDKDVYIEAGQAYMQGVFVPFGITVDDNAMGIRNGGFGSTDKK